MFEDQIASARKEGFSDDEILSYIKSNKPDLAEKIDGALKEKFTATDILNHFAPKSRPAEPSAFDLGYLGGQFKRGLGAGIEGYAKTARVLGADAENVRPFEEAGQRMQQGAPRSAMERFSNPGANDVTLGGKSLSAIPGVVAEGGAGLLADLGAMAAGTAVAGPAGGIALPIASYGAREYGRQLEERQANNGGAPVTGGDQAAVGASVLAQGALNRLGLKGIAPATNLAERGLIDAGKRVVTATGLEGATNAAQEGLSQVGTVAGTTKGEFEPGKIVDAGLIGGAIGGTVRSAAEVGKGVRGGIAEVAKRGYDFQEVMPDVAAEINKVSEAAGRKLGDRYHDAASLKEYGEVLRQERTNLNKEATRAVDEAFARQEINEKQHAMAMEALQANQPTKANVSALESVIGGKQELQGAIDLAKRASVVEQLKTKSNFTEGKETLFKGKVPYVSGGFSRVGERFIDKAKAVAGGAALGGGITYAGLKGLGAFTSTATALTNAAPMLGALVGGYQGTKLLDKALGTYSPVRQFVEHNIPKTMEPRAPGGDLPSIRQERADEAAAAQTMREQRVADIQAAREQRAQEKADKAAEREADSRDREAIAAGKQNVSNEKAQADQALKLADIQRKIDKAQGITRDESEYESIASIRGDLTDTIRQAKMALSKAQAEKKAPTKEPKQPKEQVDPAAAEREAQTIQTGQANKVQEVVLAGQAKALAQAIRKLDEKNGVAPDEAKYANIESLRDPEFLPQALERANADLKAAGKKATTAQAAKEKAPTQKGEPPKAKSKKTDEAPQNPEDTRYDVAGVDRKEAYRREVEFRQEMRDKAVDNFIKGHSLKGKKEAYVREQLSKLNGSLNNIDAVLAKFSEMGKKYKGLEEKLNDHFYEGGASNPDNYLNRTYDSKRLRGKVQTGRDGDIAAGRKRKRDD